MLLSLVAVRWRLLVALKVTQHPLEQAHMSVSCSHVEGGDRRLRACGNTIQHSVEALGAQVAMKWTAESSTAQHTLAMSG